MPISRAQQRNAVSEGIALGLLLLGRSEFRYDKMRLDLAFVGALRGWAHRSKFPQVNTDVSKGLDGVHALTHAERSRQVWCLYWEHKGNHWVIQARQADWHADNPDDVEYALSVIGGDVPLEGWICLAQDFLERFDREYGR